MSERTDVLFRLKYKKNGKLYEDDILEEIDLYDSITELQSENTVIYENEEKLILRGYSNYIYLNTFRPSELMDEFFETAKEYDIENIYYIYCNYSEILDFIYFGVVNLDILNNKMYTKIDKEEKYSDVLEEIYGVGILDKIEESYETMEDIELSEFQEERWLKVNKYCYDKFIDYIGNVEIDKELLSLEKILETLE